MSSAGTPPARRVSAIYSTIAGTCPCPCAVRKVISRSKIARACCWCGDKGAAAACPDGAVCAAPGMIGKMHAASANPMNRIRRLPLS